MTGSGVEQRLVRLEELFHEALEMSAREQEVFLAALEESEPRLAEELRPLLGADRALLDRGSGTKAGTGLLGARLEAGASFGSYRIERVLGEGGMGTVYLAQGGEPLHRKVALKVIRSAMTTAEMVLRFRMEREALARMDHPSIARVYDAGTTDEGLSFLAMEYVPGERITDHCDRHRVPVRDRVRLLRAVCEAVHHAHQKGVIHRDLKPSNVLVTARDGSFCPKVIDFGVAKATGADLQGEAVELTRTGRFVGTPGYMSPEQAGLLGGGVDLRSDVYSLGVLLYQLVSGELPISVDSTEGGIVQLADAIQNHTPEAPSAQVAREGRQDTAEARGARSPAALAKELRGDLDWVVMRAIEKEPARRYSSAAELAQDLGRYLDGDSVLAGPPDLAYRLSKLMARNRTAVVSIGLALWVAFVGLAAVLVVQTRARAELEDKNTELEAAYAAAQEKTEEIARLRVAFVLDQLEATAGDLWPAGPSRLDDLRAWIEKADEVLGPLEELRETLEELEDEGAWSEETGWQFERAEDQFHHQLLDEVVTRLDAFRHPDDGLYADVCRREEIAATIEERSVVRHAEAWAAAAERVAADGRFRGLDLRPQIGLVPLGPDPVSGLEEFVELRTGEVPTRAVDGTLLFGAASGVVLVLIPPVTFTMGNLNETMPRRRFLPTHPDHPRDDVALDAFFISKYELTRAQWMRMDRGEDPSAMKLPYFHNRTGERIRDLSTHPVESVGWGRSRELLGRIGLRLPTDAQWEAMARAGTTTLWWTGNHVNTLEGAENLGEDAAGRTPGKGLQDGFKLSAPVGSFAANPYGIHDVCGNVTEWCEDSYVNLGTTEREGDGLRSGTTHLRLVRGGNFLQVSALAHIDRRATSTSNRVSETLGVRPARPLHP